VVLAAWYKRELKESFLGKVYMNKSRLKGIDQDPKNNQFIYLQYLRAFKKGVFNFIKEDVDKYSNEVIPKKYFSGGTVTKYGDKLHIMPASPDQLADVAMKSPDEDIVGVINNEVASDAAMNAVESGDRAMHTDQIPPHIQKGGERAKSPKQLGGLTEVFKMRENHKSLKFDLAMKTIWESKVYHDNSEMLSDLFNLYYQLAVKKPNGTVKFMLDFPERLKYNLFYKNQSIDSKLTSNEDELRVFFQQTVMPLLTKYLGLSETSRINPKSTFSLRVTKTDDDLLIIQLKVRDPVTGEPSYLGVVDVDFQRKVHPDVKYDSLQGFWDWMIRFYSGEKSSFGDPVKGTFNDVAYVLDGNSQRPYISALQAQQQNALRGQQEDPVKIQIWVPQRADLTFVNGLQIPSINATNFLYQVYDQFLYNMNLVTNGSLKGYFSDNGELYVDKLERLYLEGFRAMENIYKLAGERKIDGINMQRMIFLMAQHPGEDVFVPQDDGNVWVDQAFNDDLSTFQEKLKIIRGLSGTSNVRGEFNKKVYEARKEGDSIKVNRIDEAMATNFAAISGPSMPGGIDVNAIYLNLHIKRDSNGAPLPLTQQDMAQLNNLAGLNPVILKIQPAIESSFLKQILTNQPK